MELLISISALVLSILALRRSQMTDKVQRFTAIQEALVEPHAQRGRRLLYGCRDFDDKKKNRPAEWDDMTHAVAMLALLAYLPREEMGSI
jgi:hypothetical protein